jgi:hypothetical protein
VDGSNNDLARVHAALRAQQAVVGAVLLGGSDVVPSIRVDVIDPQLRATMGALVDADSDNFIVWSDEPYSDLDGDRVGELPVSRIPDARDADLFLRALSAEAPPAASWFGVRNVARPFATGVWNNFAGNTPLEVSQQFLSAQINDQQTSSALHYFMLHGDDKDGRVFFGERGSDYTRAFDIEHVPTSFRGVVFTGCCWGALIVSSKASDPSPSVAPRMTERSIALSYLKAGANAFVGCTGSHYSGPDVSPATNPAIEMHNAFWTALRASGFCAAPALFRARTEYAQAIARRAGRLGALALAQRLKNRAQFTCLGLGW